MTGPLPPHVVRAERIRELYGRAGSPIYAACLITVLAAAQGVAVIWPVIDYPRVLAWIGLMIAVEVGIAGLIRAFHRRPRDAAELKSWARRRALAEAAHGLAWAAMVPLVYASAEPITLVAVIALIAGMGGGIAAGLGVHMPSMAAFVAGCIPPAMAFLLLNRTGPNEIYASLMLLATGVLALVNGARMSGLYEESIRLRLSLAAQLDERRLLQEAAEEGRRLAEAAAAERVRFFGAASHDLRQPVHALGLYASLLRQDPPARERRELIGNVMACVDSLDRLFRGILGMASAAKAAHEANIVAFPLQEVLDRIAVQLGPEAASRGLELRLRPTRRWVRADPGVVERILANLTSNAIRYTRQGRILVAARPRGGKVDLLVADTGIGLEEAERASIFEPFYQVGLPHRDRSQGFGLGLATVRQLCLNHGFDIAVRSEPGRGAMFSVTLPLATAGALEDGTATAQAVPRRLNVLVVEDDPLVADAVTRLLSSWGADVRACGAAAEALEILAERSAGERWHALLDYRLPGDVSGLELADRIRALHEGAVAVSLLTGEADPEVFASAEQRGIPVLQKPLKPMRLRALLAEELSAPLQPRSESAALPV